MTTKIEITITENDDVIFVYMYKERTLIDKFEIAKNILSGGTKTFTKNVCDAMGNSLSQIIQSLIKGDN